MMQRLVIIGAGMASGRMIEHLLDAAPGLWDVTLFNAEPRGNYNRLMLSPVLSGEKTYAEIVTHDDAFYAARASPPVSAKRPTTGWSSPPARRPSWFRCRARTCPAWSPAAIWRIPRR